MKLTTTFVAIAACLMPLLTHAANDNRKPSDVKWVTVDDQPGGSIQVDSEGMWGPQGGKERGQAMLWVRMIPKNEKVRHAMYDMLSRYRKQQIGDVSSKIGYGLWSYQVDCSSNRLVPHDFGVYGADDEDLGGDIYDEHQALWHSARQSSPNAAVVKYACKARFQVVDRPLDTFGFFPVR